MKTQLTKEQSQHLIDLGVPKEKASLILPTDSYEMEDISITTGIPIFKLEDFLNSEILPKEIEDDEYDWWMEFYIHFSAPQQKWFVAYHDMSERGVSFVRYSEELIDALYELTCWYYGEYLKTEKK